MLVSMNFSQPHAIRMINRLRVLNLVRTNDLISRTDISKALGLNKPSCGEIVQALVDEGLLVEKEKAETATGRRPTPLSLNKTGRLVVAVDMGSRNCSMAISDLTGNTLRFERFPVSISPKPEELLVQVLKSLLRMTKGVTDQIAGVAVSVGGVVSPDGRTLAEQYDWNWKNMPLADAFTHNLKVPAIVVNNTAAMVAAERWFASPTPDRFLYVNWGEHITSSVVYGAEVISGTTQIGHIKVTDRGLCRCGGIGCLETVASGWALSEAFGGKTVKQLASDPPQGFDAAIRSACTALASVLVDAVASTGVDHVILGGGLAGLGEATITFLTSELQRLLPHRLSGTSLECSKLGERAGILGPVAVALDQFVFRQQFLDSLDAHAET
jgi:predicted NBD/HSP70 family sugar kinase